MSAITGATNTGSRSRRAHTKTIERYFSILKRGIIATFNHVGQQHSLPYVAEYDCPYNHRKFTKKIHGVTVKSGLTDAL